MNFFNKVLKAKGIAEGYNIEKPLIFVPWGITAEKLEDLFKHHDLKKVTGGYYTIECVSLGGLKHRLGFHFRQDKSGTLALLEFFRENYPDYNKSFEEFQKHFTDCFGKPSKEYPINEEGFPSYEWNLHDGICIRHYIMDRFGLEERLYIEKKTI